MTKRQAVLKSYVVWAWLAHSLLSKRYYPLVNDLNLKAEYFFCALCEFAGYHKETQNQEKCVFNCPMKGRWTPISAPTCYTNDTDYNKWEFFTSAKVNSVSAGNVAASLWKLYKELEEK
jgi:hypothetical protein